MLRCIIGNEQLFVESLLAPAPPSLAAAPPRHVANRSIIAGTQLCIHLHHPSTSIRRSVVGHNSDLGHSSNQLQAAPLDRAANGIECNIVGQASVSARFGF
jgi:hypothetical protein